MAKPKKPAKKIKAAAKSKPRPAAKPVAKKASKMTAKAVAPKLESARSLSDVMKSSALRRLMVR